MREYIVWKHYDNAVLSERRAFNSFDDMKPVLYKEYSQHAQDAGYNRISITALPCDGIDFELIERMNATRDMCELGNKVRATTKIRNRQPLRHAYVAFSDRDIQDHMLYGDPLREFEEIIKDELNVLDVVFMNEEDERSIFNYKMKPNFRALGPKGYGKQAQTIKTTLQNTFTQEEVNNLHARLKKGETVEVQGVPLTYSDVEVEFSPKDGYMSASSKVGAIVLNTTLDQHLFQLGFVADFRSSVQNIRKTANLGVTDKIFLEVFCEAHRSRTLDAFCYSLRRELLATDIKFFPPTEVNDKVAHRFYFHGGSLKSATQLQDVDEAELDKEPFYVNLYKEV